MTLPADLSPGAVWDDRYRILDYLGSGAGADAVRATELATGAAVVLKVLRVAHEARPLPGEIFGDALLRGLFVHPSIVPVTRVGLVPRPYSVADFCAHQTVDLYLRRHGRPQPEDLVAFAKELVGLCLGLRDLGLYWLDVSMTNVCLLTQAPAWSAIRVVDLGACAVGSETLRLFLSSQGASMSPESEWTAASTQTRRVRLLLRFIAGWQKETNASELPPELGEWLAHEPERALEESPMEIWAQRLGAGPAAVASQLREPQPPTVASEHLRHFLSRRAGAAVALVGAPGSGKSKLLAQALYSLADAGVLLWQVLPCFTLPVGSGWQALRSHLSKWAKSDDESIWGQRLSELNASSPLIAVAVEDAHACSPETLRVLNLMASYRQAPILYLFAGRATGDWLERLPKPVTVIEL